MPRKLTVTERTIFSPPHKGQMVSEGESQGRHLDTGLYSQTRSTGPNGQLPLHLGPTKTSAKVLARSRSVRIGVVRFKKKVWSPTCPLNGSFQSPNCPLKGFFTRQTGFFSRKWPDGGRFFEPCISIGWENSATDLRLDESIEE